MVSYQWNRTGITVAGRSDGTLGTASDQLSHAYGLTIDSSNSLYIGDFANNRIQKWLFNASNGTTVAGMANGTAGASSIAFSSPVSVALDSSGNMYISDRDNHRVVYWPKNASSGITVAGTTGISGSGNNTLYGPCGISRDSNTGTLYIADTFNHRVMQYLFNASSGTRVAGGNGPGTGITKLNYPYGFTFDSTSNSLLIANYGTHNIVRWILGASSWILVAGSSSGVSGNTSTLLNQPIGVALDFMGNMYVADSANHRIQFFLAGKSNGTTLAGITGSPNTTATQLNYPYWAIVDSQLNLYVADTSNNRVQMFRHY